MSRCPLIWPQPITSLSDQEAAQPEHQPRESVSEPGSQTDHGDRAVGTYSPGEPRAPVVARPHSKPGEPDLPRRLSKPASPQSTKIEWMIDSSLLSHQRPV